MPTQGVWPVAIIGSGNIGTDLTIKIRRSDGPLQIAAMVGIDPASDGLARADRMGVPITTGGIDGLVQNGEAMVIVRGPEAFVTPPWYPTKGKNHRWSSRASKHVAAPTTPPSEPTTHHRSPADTPAPYQYVHIGFWLWH